MLRRKLADTISKHWEKSAEQRMQSRTLLSDIEEHKEISYQNTSNGGYTLDIYKKAGADRALPVFMDLHGGGFMYNDKELDRAFGHHVAEKNMLVFNLNYPLAAKNITVFEQICAVVRAAEWICENAETYGADISRTVICGHSAGAILAIMAGIIAGNPFVGEIYGCQWPANMNVSSVVSDCGLLEVYKDSLAYWGMRSMIFPRGYAGDARYKQIVFKSANNLNSVKKYYIISNPKDELMRQTVDFKHILDSNGAESAIDLGGDDGHMGIIYDPSCDKNQKIISDMLSYSLA